MITRADILPNAEYLAVRPAREREAIAAAAVRRVAVGPNLTVLFENRTSVLWQIQEMCRVELIVADTAIQHELDTYGAILPGPFELSATLLVEYPDPDERDRALRRLVGLHEHVFLEVDGERVPARFDGEQFNTKRISSVQFLRIPLTPAQRAAFFDLARPARLVVDHEAYAATVDLPPPTRGALAQDLLEAERSSG
jgi:hypothetical protein